jgi:hypothetical protein
MTTNTDGASSSIVITSARVLLTPLSRNNQLLQIRFKSENHRPANALLYIYPSRTSLTPVIITEVKATIVYVPEAQESTFGMTWGALPTSVTTVGQPILRVQLKFENLESNIQDCEVDFPRYTSSITVEQSEAITVAWQLKDVDANFPYSPPLYFVEELSNGNNIQRATKKIYALSGVATEMTVTPDAAIKKDDVFQCRNTLAYGDPEAGAGSHVLSAKWSEPVAIIDKPVAITSVSCAKAANGNFTLEVKWQNSSLSLGVKLVIRSDAVPPRQQACQPGATSFTFTNLELDPHKAYTVAAFYYKDSAVGPESEPIPILQVPVEFNLNYYEKGTQLQLEARWQKQAPPDCVYRVVVSKDGVAGNAVDTNSDSLVLGSDTANSGQRITATIRAAKGISTGPVSDSVPAPFVSESAFAFDDLGRLREVAADKKQKTTFTYDERGNITTVQ